MEKLFVAVTIACLGTILISVSAHAARNLAPDDKGNLFVADTDSASILKFTSDGKRSTFASGLNDANDMAFDDKGKLLVRDGNTIIKFTPEGVKSTVAAGVSPDKMAVDGVGNLFAADGNTILKFTPDGKKSTFATGINPGDLVFDRAGNLFVTDPGSDSILKFTPDGKKGTFATGISYPGDLVFDGAGNLFVSGSGLIFKFTPDGTRSTLVSDRVSPDKQWEYHSDARIVKAGTSQAVLDLSKSEPENAKIVWAPDSKRFALNYGQTCKHCTYDTIAFYQLRDDKWVALRSLVDERSERGQLAQLAKEHLPKSAHERRIWRSQPTHDLLKVREWIDANTAILYAYSQWFVGGDQGDLEANFLFTLKFDADGNWKIVKTHQMSDKEIEKKDAGEDVSGSRQTTEQEGLSADASFREADRQLNEVYNALRGRLSPPERDRLRKEQLAWINRRNAAAQVAKGNAEGNPTHAGDGDVTKMTLARAAELEKRLKKAK